MLGPRHIGTLYGYMQALLCTGQSAHCQHDYKAHIGINNGLDNEACHLHVTVRWMAGELLQLDPNARSNSEEGINAGLMPSLLTQGGT